MVKDKKKKRPNDLFFKTIFYNRSERWFMKICLEKDIIFLNNQGYSYISSSKNKKGETCYKIKHLKCGKVYSVRRTKFFNENQRCTCSRKNKYSRYNSISDIQNFIDAKFGNNIYRVIDKYYIGRKYPLSVLEISAGTISEIKFDAILDDRVHSLKNYFELKDHKKYFQKILDDKCLKVYGKKKFILLDFNGQNTKKDNHSTFKCILCGNEFKRRAEDILRTCRCPICENKSRKDITIEDVKKEVVNIGSNEYAVISTTYNGTNFPIKIKHKKCGEIFFMSRTNFIRGERCPFCKQSKGEKAIASFFKNNETKFTKEKRFNECKSINCLPFDFYLDNYKILIEYDGIQHFEKSFGKDNIKNQKKHDKIKNRYCRSNKIPLLRIGFWDKDNIEKILGSLLSFISSKNGKFSYTAFENWRKSLHLKTYAEYKKEKAK